MSLFAVFTTVATHDDARRLARGAVEARLAACVQISAIQSVYHWQGALQEDDELRLLFKTPAAQREALCAWLRERHPYELPAIYALDVAEADAAYASWVEDSTR